MPAVKSPAMKTTDTVKRTPFAWSSVLWLIELAAWILVLLWFLDLGALWSFVV